MKKKPLSPLRKVLREVQLIISLGLVVLVLYALVASSLVLALSAPALSNPRAQLLLAFAISHAPLFVILPALCFAMRWVVDIDPWRLGIGAAMFAKLALIALRWVSGGFDEAGVDVGLVAEVLAFAAAGAVGSLAAQVAARKVAAATAAGAAPTSAPEPALGDELRQIQESARAAPQPAETAKKA